MTRHYLGFSILILLLALVQISAIEPNWQQAESGPVLKVVPHVLSDGYTILLFTVLEGNVAYLRVNQVTNGLAAELQSAQTALAATNKIIGTVLDLRFADGNDLTVANATTNWFAAKKLPLAILINSETRGAALALAKDLRAAHDGLILGGAAAELKPDIAVIVKITDEKQFLDNPYAAVATGETNASAATNGNLATFIDHTTEADLVREKIKDGDQDEDSTPARPTEPQKPYIHDPTLARAVDLIKALAVIRQSHG
jgi:hypothetical protein